MASANDRHPIMTQAAPAAIGPYSQAISSADLLFLSGQIPLDPTTGEMITGDVRAQTERVMANLEAVLAAGGTSFERVLKTTIFVTDLADFKTVNEVYATRFVGVAPPARSTVQVAALPRGAKVEIEMIARL